MSNSNGTFNRVLSTPLCLAPDLIHTAEKDDETRSLEWAGDKCSIRGLYPALEAKVTLVFTSFGDIFSLA